MIGFIPAAGTGERLKPLTLNTPKELLLVNDKPVIDYVLEQFKVAKIKRVFLLINKEKFKIIEHVGNGKKFNLSVCYLIQEKKEGLAKAINEVKEFVSEDVSIILGDNLIFPKDSLKKLILFHKKEGSDTTLMLHEVKNPKEFGVAKLVNNNVVSIEEKPKLPKTNLAVVGAYIFNKKIFKAIEKTKQGVKGEYQITDSIKILINEGKKVKGLVHKGEWFDIGTFESYEKARAFLKNNPSIEVVI